MWYMLLKQIHFTRLLAHPPLHDTQIPLPSERNISLYLHIGLSVCLCFFSPSIQLSAQRRVMDAAKEVTYKKTDDENSTLLGCRSVFSLRVFKERSAVFSSGRLVNNYSSLKSFQVLLVTVNSSLVLYLQNRIKLCIGTNKSTDVSKSYILDICLTVHHQCR